MTYKPLPGLTGERNRIFWSSFTSEEFSQLVKTSILSEKHKRLFYHLHDMQDVPEGNVVLEVDASQIDQLVKRSKKQRTR
jgi:hypothetical protein